MKIGQKGNAKDDNRNNKNQLSQESFVNFESIDR